MTTLNDVEVESRDDVASDFSTAGMSFYRKLRVTPWGDLRRGRLSGRFEVEGRIAQSGLPEEVRELVRGVMKRVGLWRGERVEVVEELLVHFQDGVGAGVGAAELVGSFGEVKQIAALIRRSKKRQRPRSWIMLMTMCKGVGVLLAFFVMWYVGALFYYFSGEPVISRDYVAEMTAEARRVPEGERAWPIYREALVAMKGDLEALNGSATDVWKPGGVEWSETVAFLNQYEAELTMVRRGAGMPGLGFVASHSISAADAALWPDRVGTASAAGNALFANMVSSVQVPQLRMLRNLAGPLSADAYLAAAQGDGARVVANIRGLLGIARHSRETALLISDLVSMALTKVALMTLGDILRTDATLLTTGELRRLAHEIGALEGGEQGELGARINSERRMVYDLLQRIYTDDGNGDGHLSPKGMSLLGQLTTNSPISGEDAGEGTWGWSSILIPAAGVVMADRREMRTEYDYWMERIAVEAALPLWERPEQGVEAELAQQGKKALWSTKYFLVWTMIPSISRAALQEQKTLMERDGVLTALALELWRRDHDGEWPADLELLVPQYLPTLPIDRFTGMVMGYQLRNDDTVVVYGVGADLDDDGGAGPTVDSALIRRVSEWQHPGRVVASELPDGDWILWASGGD